MCQCHLIRSLLKDCEVSESVFKTPFCPVFVAIQTRGCRSVQHQHHFDRILPPLSELWESITPPYKLMSLQTSFGETMTHFMLILWRLRCAHMHWSKSVNQLDILKLDLMMGRTGVTIFVQLAHTFLSGCSKDSAEGRLLVWIWDGWRMANCNIVLGLMSKSRKPMLESFLMEQNECSPKIGCSPPSLLPPCLCS